MIRTLTMSLLLLALIPATVGCTSKDETRDVQAQNIEAPEELPEIRLEKAFPKVEFHKPLAMVAQPGKGEWLHVVEQLGRVYRIKNDAKSSVKELVLDLTDRIPKKRRNMEEGLLAFRFHPDFTGNGYAFVSYSMHKGGGKPRRGVLSRFTFKDKKFDTSSEKIILEVKQPYGNHNGCEILFGDDGFLYASFGDGGAAHDPHDNSQNKNTILGSIIRIDVDSEDEGNAYAIPEDNPFVKEKDARGEIWAYGLRNVWRMAFDRETGLLWAGDVGQNAWEEIDIIEKGGNYGWNAREGKHEFQGRKKTSDMIDPVAEYPHAKGVSVVGGYVYRGKKHTALNDVYFYADFYTGRVWGLSYDVENKKVKHNELLGHFSGVNIAAFAEDADGELFVINHRGDIQRVIPAPKGD